MAVPACCRTARARGAVPTGRQSGRSTSANDQPAHVHRARSCRTAHPVRLAVVPSSTQFLPLNRTESVRLSPFRPARFSTKSARIDRLQPLISAPPVILQSTHEAALDVLDLAGLKRRELELS